jgi:hypothetical protein
MPKPEKPNGLSVTSGVRVHLNIPKDSDTLRLGFITLAPEDARQLGFDLISAAHRSENLHEPPPE